MVSAAVNKADFCFISTDTAQTQRKYKILIFFDGIVVVKNIIFRFSQCLCNIFSIPFGYDSTAANTRFISVTFLIYCKSPCFSIIICEHNKTVIIILHHLIKQLCGLLGILRRHISDMTVGNKICKSVKGMAEKHIVIIFFSLLHHRINFRINFFIVYSLPLTQRIINFHVTDNSFIAFRHGHSRIVQCTDIKCRYSCHRNECTAEYQHRTKYFTCMKKNFFSAKGRHKREKYRCNVCQAK